MPTIPRPSSAERFHASVQVGGPDECWEWQKYRNAQGYGTLYYAGQMSKAHRIAWELVNGPILAGRCVLHCCDNPPCCNPRHLWLGDRKANNEDKESKGRGGHLSGEDHGSAILTAVQVAEIRECYARGGITQPALGARYGVSRQTVSAIVRRERWGETTSSDRPVEDRGLPPERRV